MTKQGLLNAVAWANYANLLAMMVVVAGTLTAAMSLQYVDGELPYPFCLLERIALVVLIAYGAKLAMLGGDRYLEQTQVDHFPMLRKIANVVGIYLIVICVINTVSVFVQCGIGQCYTFGYKLLE